ncbi:hypothetical protein FHW73_002669 [Luteimonas sp. RC10]|nr:hypothetical protein [Luteimonas sp. RC10]
MLQRCSAEDRDYLPRLRGEVDARSAAGGGWGFPELQTTRPRGRAPPHPSPPPHAGEGAQRCSAKDRDTFPHAGRSTVLRHQRSRHLPHARRECAP